MTIVNGDQEQPALSFLRDSGISFAITIAFFWQDHSPEFKSRFSLQRRFNNDNTLD
jgi:hypothetical protein